jgi:hypothetical protein
MTQTQTQIKSLNLMLSQNLRGILFVRIDDRKKSNVDFNNFFYRIVINDLF